MQQDAARDAALCCGTRFSCPDATELVTQVAVGILCALVGMLVALMFSGTAAVAVACVFLFAQAIVAPLLARLIADMLKRDPGPSPYTRVSAEIADKL